MIRFEDFLDHESDIISQTAEILAEAQGEFDANNMTRSEFTEIADNLLGVIQIDSLTQDVDRKVAISETIKTLKTIVSNIPMT